jgi:hypothetical protein
METGGRPMDLRRTLPLIAAAALLGACAENPPREQPHHYSTARDGTRTACYTTQVANEYECIPLRPARDYYDPYYDAYYDPFWPHLGFGWYGWPYPDYVLYPYPVIVRQPPPHFRPRSAGPSATVEARTAPPHVAPAPMRPRRRQSPSG